MANPQDIYKQSQLKATNLEKAIELMETRIDQSSNRMTRALFKNFLEKLNRDNGRITHIQDSQTVLLFNMAYIKISTVLAREIYKSTATDIEAILTENKKFYTKVAKPTKEQKAFIRKTIYKNLGIKLDGTLVRNGFMNGIFKDSSLKSTLFKFVFSEMTKGVGYESLRKNLKTFIEGNDKKVGAFKAFYKTFSYDVYSHTNAYNGALYAEQLGLKHFIYNGGIIKGSRAFCIEKNGKVFSTEEAEKWKDDPKLTAITDKESYNWKMDRGGYNCRHSIDYIPLEIAKALREDL